MSKKAYNILVTGVGAIIGYGIINSLKKTKYELHIFGMDIYNDAYGSVLVDTFILAKRADDENYIQFINSIVDKYQIDLIITGIEQDLYSLFQNKDVINTEVVFNNELCINLSKDKLETYRYLKTFKQIQLIPTLYNEDFDICKNTLGLPFMLKPRKSYASKGIMTITNQNEFNFYSDQINRNCVYQKIIGDNEEEYTVSVFGDGKGNYFDYIILRRKLSEEGATSKATLIQNDEKIIEYIASLCRILKPEGPTNIQLRKEKDKVYLLEINPRISSACSIRTLLGYNEPEMCIKYYLTKEKIISKPKKNGHIVRFIVDQILNV